MQERKVGKSIVDSLAETMPTMNHLMVNSIADMMPTMKLPLLIIRLENDKRELEKNPNVVVARIEDIVKKIKICREVYQRRVGLMMPNTEKIIDLTSFISEYLFITECLSPTNDLNPFQEALLQLINSIISVMDGDDGFDKKYLHNYFEEFSQRLYKLTSHSIELSSSFRNAIFSLSFELGKTC